MCISLFFWNSHHRRKVALSSLWPYCEGAWLACVYYIISLNLSETILYLQLYTPLSYKFHAGTAPTTSMLKISMLLCTASAIKWNRKIYDKSLTQLMNMHFFSMALNFDKPVLNTVYSHRKQPISSFLVRNGVQNIF